MDARYEGDIRRQLAVKYFVHPITTDETDDADAHARQAPSPQRPDDTSSWERSTEYMNFG
jgi:hypothetical protein